MLSNQRYLMAFLRFNQTAVLQKKKIINNNCYTYRRRFLKTFFKRHFEITFKLSGLLIYSIRIRADISGWIRTHKTSPA